MEWAAGGPDARPYPWGFGVDVGWANLRSPHGTSMPVPVGGFPVDCSVFEIVDLGGGISEWTSTVEPRSGMGILKGGSYATQHAQARIDQDRYARPQEGFAQYGMRILCEL